MSGHRHSPVGGSGRPAPASSSAQSSRG
jgi:hypothetical protein